MSEAGDHGGDAGRSLTGAILAGGGSTRMGRDKARLVLPDGRAMAETVADALRAVTDRIVVVGPPDALPGTPAVPDRRPGLGPLGGLEALLASGLDEHYLVCPCDMPRVDAAILALLCRPSSRPGAVLRVKGEEEPRPLPARFDATLLPVVERRLDEGRRSVRGLLAEIDPEIIDVPAARAALLANINDSAEWNREVASRTRGGG